MMRKTYKLWVFLFLSISLSLAVVLINQRTHTRQYAYNQDGFEYTEQKFDELAPNAPLNTNGVVPKTNKLATELPVTGTWLGYNVKVVPDSVFTDYFGSSTSYEIQSVKSMVDGKLFLGGYNVFAIKNEEDKTWEGLTFYPFDVGTAITYFVPTAGEDYEVYFGYSRVIRRLSNGQLEVVADPFDGSGKLRDVSIVAYPNSQGVVAFRNTEMYYLEKGALRKWLTPYRPYCSQQDQILSMFSDDSGFYGLILEKYTSPTCGAQFETRLYKFVFSSDPSVPLQAIRLGRVDNMGSQSFSKAFISFRKDETNQKTLYGFRKLENYLYTIPYLYTDGRNMVMEKTRIDNESWPSIYDFSVESNTAPDTDNVWLIAEEIKGIYLGQNFDYPSNHFFYNTQDNTVLANPYVNSITVDDNDGTIYTGHKILTGQFNNAAVTILEKRGPSQILDLLTGWNWISLKTISDNTEVSYVLSGIDGKYDMVLSEEGAYSPTLPPVYNTLNNLEAGKMYLIHMTEPATLGLYGQTINEATPINLHTGWNWIGYYPNIVQPISQVLSSITGQYQRVLSEDEYYDPSNPDGSSLLFMTPDEGYMIYSNIDQQLVYSIGQTTPITNNKSSCQKTITEAYTNIYTEKIKTYPNGSVVKVKNANNQIVGCGLISNNRLTITRLFGEEVVNGITYPGLKQNETPKIEIYNPEDKLIGAEKVDFKFNADKSVHKISFAVPTPTVTRKPTATPTPKNNPPIIETKSLPVGIVGKKYLANVIAADRDGDRLKMKISNLPTGLKSENCKTSFGKMTCTITGIPQKVGLNKVLVEVWDDRGASTNKTFLLYIKSWLKKDINQQ